MAIKTRMMRWVGHVARWGSNKYKRNFGL